MRIYPLFIAHAGCPHRCLFCAQQRSSGQPVASADVQAVDEWLDRNLPTAGDGEIAFYGGTFSLLPAALQAGYLACAGAFVAKGRVAGIRISTRPDALDDDCLQRLQAAGVTTIEIGCQSFDDSVLAAAGRGHSAADSISALQRCLQAGFLVGAQLMPGLPGSDALEATQSLRQVLLLKVSFVRIYPTVVIAGTELEQLWREGRYSPWSLDEAVDVCADLLQFCRSAKVPVVRLGLQQDRLLEENLLAGPYHPAFGQLVRSRLWRRALMHPSANAGQIEVNPKDLSDLLGHRGENREWFRATMPAASVRVDESVARGCVRLSGQTLPLTDLSLQGGPLG